MSPKSLQGRLTLEEEDALIDELLDALDESVRRSGCADMRPLWFLATKQARADFIQQSGGVVANVPDSIQRWNKSKRSKYAALAAWRQVTLWREALAQLPAKLRQAVEDIYFTPFKKNEPPYAWTKASSQAPAVARYSSPSTLDMNAKRGCVELLKSLQKLTTKSGGLSLVDEARVAFTAAGTRKTLYEMLRIERFR